MSESTDLQRRYRRLLAFYPRSFRRENEQEIVSVLMAGAAPGQRRPGLAESANLLANGIWMRLRHTQIPSNFERRHPALWIWVRDLSGIWLVILTGILCQSGRWWGLALLAPAALHFYLVFRLGRPAMQREREQGWHGSEPPPAAGR